MSEKKSVWSYVKKGFSILADIVKGFWKIITTFWKTSNFVADVLLDHRTVIIFCLACVPAVINPSGFSYYHFVIESDMVTLHGLFKEFNKVQVLLAFIGLIIAIAPIMFTLTGWDSLKKPREKFFSLLITIGSATVVTAFFKEQLFQNPKSFTYIFFYAVIAFNLYAIYKNRNNLRIFSLRGIRNASGDEPECTDDHDDDE